MSEYSSLKATINANVKTNDNHEITGSIMNSVLNAMVNSLGAGYQFMGVATPTNPGSAQTPDYKCFYLATTPGTYRYLGGLVVADGEVALLKYDSSWTKEVTGVASADKLNQLGQEESDIINVLGLILNSFPIDVVDANASASTYGANMWWGNLQNKSKVRYLAYKKLSLTGLNTLKVGKVKQSSNAITEIKTFDIEKLTGGLWYLLDLGSEVSLADDEYIIVSGPVYYKNDSLSDYPNKRIIINTTESSYSYDNNGYFGIVPIENQGNIIGGLFDLIEQQNGVIGKQNLVLDDCTQSLDINNPSYQQYIFCNKLYYRNIKQFILKLVNGASSVSTYKVRTDGIFESIETINISSAESLGNNLYLFTLSTPYEFAENEYLGINGAIYYSGSVGTHSNGRIIVQISSGTVTFDNGSAGISVIQSLADRIFTLETKKGANEGKIVSIIGDSISTFTGIDSMVHPYYPNSDVQSVNDTWWGMMLSKMKAKRGYNSSIGGSCIAHKSGESYTCFDDSSRYLSLKTSGTTGTNPDIIIGFGGVNDWVYEIPIGTKDDDYSNPNGTTLYAALRHLITMLQTTYTNAYIYWVTPIRNWYETDVNIPPTRNGVELKSYIDAIKDICQLHGVKCIDLYTNLGFNYNNRSIKQIDGLHPKKAGMADICNYIYNAIMSDF